jgi:hypothetical protein
LTIPFSHVRILRQCYKNSEVKEYTLTKINTESLRYNSEYIGEESLLKILHCDREDLEDALENMGVGHIDTITGRIFLERRHVDEISPYRVKPKLRREVYDLICDNPGISRNSLHEKMKKIGAGHRGQEGITAILAILTEKYPDLYEEDNGGLFVYGFDK